MVYSPWGWKRVNTIYRLNINNNANVISLGIVYNHKFVSFDHLHPFYPPPASGSYHSVLCFYEFWIWVFVFFRFHIQVESHSIWFISRSIIPSSSVHVFADGRNSFFSDAEFYSILYMYHIFNPLMNTDCFHVSANVNNASVNTGVQVSFQVSDFVSFG